MLPYVILASALAYCCSAVSLGYDCQKDADCTDANSMCKKYNIYWGYCDCKATFAPFRKDRYSPYTCVVACNPDADISGCTKDQYCDFRTKACIAGPERDSTGLIKLYQPGCRKNTDCSGGSLAVCDPNYRQCLCGTGATPYEGNYCIKETSCNPSNPIACNKDTEFCYSGWGICLPKVNPFNPPKVPSGPKTSDGPVKLWGGCKIDADCSGGPLSFCYMGQCICQDNCLAYNGNYCIKDITCDPNAAYSCANGQFCCPYQHKCFPNENPYDNGGSVFTSSGSTGAATGNVCGVEYADNTAPMYNPSSIGTTCPVGAGPPTRCGKDICTALWAVSEPDIVNRHNCWRDAEKSKAKTPLVPLKWDDDLADLARHWACQCTDSNNAHDAYEARTLPARNSNGVSWDYVGQNVCYSTNNMTWSKCIDEWSLEKKDFVYGVGPVTGQTGHYTQVVADRSTHVGCAAAFCPNLAMKFKLVCNYGPAGNFNGGEKKPYVLA